MNTPFLTTKHGSLFEGDCLFHLKSIKSNSIDCVFADPPFNIGKDYKNGYNDDQGKDIYIQWCHDWIIECCRVLKPGGSLFIYALPELCIQFGNILNDQLTFRHWIAISMKATFKRGKRLYPAHYGMLYYTKGDPTTFNDLRTPIPLCRHCKKEIPDYGGHRDKMNVNGVNLTDIWTDTSPNRHKKFKVRDGVNELKLMIPERAILISTNPGDIVLDPFGGGGTSYHAAEKNHRNWIGIELYDCAYIKNRLDLQFPDSVNEPPVFNLKNIYIPQRTMQPI